ncbi:unnamed protein product [Cunninghamella blakesleeana]
MIFATYHDIPTLLNLPQKQPSKKIHINNNKVDNNNNNNNNQHHNMTLSDRLAYVEALVDMNAMVIEAIWPVGSNHNNIVPLRSFIQEVLKRSRTTYSTLQTAFFYLFRARPAIMKHLLLYQQKQQLVLQQQQQQQQQQQPLKGKDAYIHCGRRMFLASLIVASKFVQDKTYRNSAWAKIAGLPVQEINTSERVFLELLDYRLYVAQNTFNQWHQLLHAHVQAKTSSPLLSPSTLHRPSTTTNHTTINNHHPNSIASLIHPHNIDTTITNNNNNNNTNTNNINTIHHILNHPSDSSSSLPSLSPSSLPSSNSSLSSTTSSPVYSPLSLSLTTTSSLLSKKRSRSNNNDNDIYQRKRPTYHV